MATLDPASAPADASPGCDDQGVSQAGPESPLRHAAAVATVRAFARAANAERVVAVVDCGEDAEPALLEWRPGAALELTEGGRTWQLADADAAAPLPLPELRPAPPSAISLDLDEGRLEAPVGAIANLADGVLGLARALGGRSVATADFATRDPELQLTIAARDGEGVLLAAGDEQFELPGL